MPYSIVPTSGQSLGVTRDPIRNNFTIIRDIFAKNHVIFDSSGEGNHTNVLFQQYATALATGAKDLLIFNDDDAATNPQLWLQPKNEANRNNAVQLTAGDITSATFGEMVAYGTPPAGYAQIGGWTFLAGNLILQYGHFYKSTAGAGVFTGTVEFPLTWAILPTNPQIYSFSMTNLKASPETYVANSLTSTNFTFVLENVLNSGISQGIYWQAIGRV